VPALRLASGGSINGAAHPLTVNNLAVQSAGDVTLTANNQINTVAASITVSGHTFSFCDGLTLEVGTVDGIVGISAGDGTATSSGTVILTADNMAINQQVNAGGGRVVLQPKTAGRAIDLGTETADKLSLTAVELANVTADVLKIGNSSAGSITISDGLDFGVNAVNPKVRTLSLQSGHEITENASGWIQVKNLGLRSPSSLGAVLVNPMNDWRRLGADLSGPLVVTEKGGYKAASAPPNDVDGLTGVSASSLNVKGAALNALAAVTYVDVPLPRPSGLFFEVAAPDTRPPGLDDPNLIWTSYLHLPEQPEEPARKIRKIEERPKWTSLSVSGSTSGPRSPE
jgi:hypothetical protein